MSKTLYICYFGVREPLVQTQVLPYLRELLKTEGSAAGARRGGEGEGEKDRSVTVDETGKGGNLKVSILTFEPGLRDGAEADRIRTELASEGIDWHWLRYHKRFSAIATAYDIVRGAWFVRQFIKQEGLDILHGRVHVPTLMAALARKFSRHKPKLLFDIRGFFPEEYTDAGIWPRDGWLYRSAKRVEGWLLKESDAFVVLTEKARDILFPGSADTGVDRLGRPVEVIPCCVNLAKFSGVDGDVRAQMRKELKIDSRRVLTYVGSFGGWYLTDEMLEFFAAAIERDPNSFAMILTQRGRENIVEKLKAKGFREGDYYVGSVPPSDLPRYLCAADVAISFIKACYSKQSSSPTKIAEYLACGLPIISNRGVGDVDLQIENNRVGVLLDNFDDAGYGKALEAVANLNGVADRCRETARREFDLGNVGGERYRRIYRSLIGS